MTIRKSNEELFMKLKSKDVGKLYKALLYIDLSQKYWIILNALIIEVYGVEGLKSIKRIAWKR